MADVTTQLSKFLASFPAVDGTNGQVLSTDGAGHWSWATGGGGGVTGLTADRITFGASGTTVQDYSFALRDPTLVNSAPAVSFLIPTHVTYTRTSTTGAFAALRSNVTVTMPSDAATGLTNQSAAQLRLNFTGTKTFDFGTGLDAYVTNNGTGTISAMTGAGGWAENLAAATVTSLIGVNAIARQTHASSVSTNIFALKVDPSDGHDDGGGDPTTKAGTNTNFYGIQLTGMNLDAMTSVNRYGLYLSAMTGTASSKDYALYSLMTQSSFLTGNLGLGTATVPVTLLDVRGAAAGAYTTAGGTVISAEIGGRTTTTSKAANNNLAGFVYETVSNLTSVAAGAYIVAGVNGLATIPSTDSGTYPSGSALYAGSYSSSYGGSGSIDTVAALNAFGFRASFAGTGGTINTLIAGVRAQAGNLENSGTIPIVAAFYAVRPLGGGSTAAVTLGAGLYLEQQTPSGTQTNTAVYGVYQAGTEGNFWGGKFTTYNNVTTAGMGVPAIYSAPAISATKTANFTVATYTPPAAAGVYKVTGVITTTSSTNTGTVQLTVDYVDSQGTTHTADIIPLVDAAGTIATTKTGASKEYHGVEYMFSINNAATAIVLKAVITGTVSYTVAGAIEQIV